MKKLYFILVMIVGCWSECIKWSCTYALEENECVQYADKFNIHVNYKKCIHGGCSYSNVTEWALTAKRGDIYYCSTGDLWDEENPTDLSNMECGSRNENKDLKEGSYPKKCTKISGENDSCVLSDGTFNECECGLNGNSYCVPDESSEIYDEYWDECSDNDGKLKDWSHYLFWQLKKLNYINYITAYTCSRDIFEEFKKLDDLDYTDDYSVFLAADVLLISLII